MSNPSELPGQSAEDLSGEERFLEAIFGKQPKQPETSEKQALSADEIAAKKSALKEKVNALLKTLSYREREIIKLRYGIDDGHSYSVEEVGQIFKVTRERIRQMESKAVRKLTRPGANQSDEKPDGEVAES